jgi:hypothetical protein
VLALALLEPEAAPRGTRSRSGARAARVAQGARA